MVSYERDLGGGLVLRTVRSERDAQRYVDFAGALWGQATGISCGYLLRRRPHTTWDDFLYVEDTSSGQLVSTTCLLPWRWRFEDVVLDVAMLEMVGTRADYRNRGLIRAQVERFHEVTRDRGFDLCIIEGIPCYYRQFGYGYGLDHWAHDSLPSWCIPDAREGAPSPYRLRPAVLDDVELLASLYEQAMTAVQCHCLRDAGYWRFLLEHVRFPARIVESCRDGRPAGYVCSALGAGGGGVNVMESGIASAEVALWVLRLLKAEGGGEIRLAWPQEGALVQLARSLGGSPLPHYQWLLRIPDPLRLLTRMTPLLQRRVAGSPYAGLTRDVCLNLYRHAYTLHFENGQVRAGPAGFVDASMGADGGDVRLPPEAFARLIFGYRTFEQLWDAWPDIGAKPECRGLVDVLFPRLSSYFNTPYMYCGPALGAATT